MKVNVWTEYHWECSRCGDINRVNYMPSVGKNLPPCQSCSKVDKCENITESCNPNE